MRWWNRNCKSLKTIIFKITKMDKYLSVVPKIPSVLIIWKLFETLCKNGSLTKFIVDKDGEYVEHKQNGLKFNNSWFQFGIAQHRSETDSEWSKKKTLLHSFFQIWDEKWREKRRKKPTNFKSFQKCSASFFVGLHKCDNVDFGTFRISLVSLKSYMQHFTYECAWCHNPRDFLHSHSFFSARLQCGILLKFDYESSWCWRSMQFMT